MNWLKKLFGKAFPSKINLALSLNFDNEEQKLNALRCLHQACKELYTHVVRRRFGICVQMPQLREKRLFLEVLVEASKSLGYYDNKSSTVYPIGGERVYWDTLDKWADGKRYRVLMKMMDICERELKKRGERL